VPATNDDVLRAVNAVAAEQGRVSAALEGHVRLDDERFRGIKESMARIEASQVEGKATLDTLVKQRAFDRGARWAAVKVAGLVSFLVSAAFSVAAWAGLAPGFHK
jgi:hypothetical protein